MVYTVRNGVPLKRGLRPAIALCLGLVGGSCMLTEPLPSGATHLDPLPQYQVWWSMVEECSGIERPMREIGWYTVPGATVPMSRGGAATGLYRVGANAIVLAGDAVRDGSLVRHEILHALLDTDREPQHPREYFLARCGGVVTCLTPCVSTSGGAVYPPEPGAPADPSVLEMALTVEPDVISLGDGSPGYVRIVVTARNPRTTPINVQRSTYPGRTFAVTLRGPVSSVYMDALQPDWSATWFAVGETKRQVFDFYASDVPAALGEWRATAAFANQVPRATTTLRITP